MSDQRLDAVAHAIRYSIGPISAGHVGREETTRIQARAAIEASDDLVFSDEAVERAANVLLREQTGGNCQLGRVCSLCDCFAKYDPAFIKDRDNYARDHVRAVITALRGEQA